MDIHYHTYKHLLEDVRKNLQIIQRDGPDTRIDDPEKLIEAQANIIDELVRINDEMLNYILSIKEIKDSYQVNQSIRHDPMELMSLVVETVEIPPIKLIRFV